MQKYRSIKASATSQRSEAAGRHRALLNVLSFHQEVEQKSAERQEELKRKLQQGEVDMAGLWEENTVLAEENDDLEKEKAALQSENVRLKSQNRFLCIILSFVSRDPGATRDGTKGEQEAK